MKRLAEKCGPHGPPMSSASVREADAATEYPVAPGFPNPHLAIEP